MIWDKDLNETRRKKISPEHKKITRADIKYTILDLVHSFIIIKTKASLLLA